MEKKVSLTGIKPTGTPHIGNYFGAIKPAIEMTQSYSARYFIADYHALNQVKDAKVLNKYIYEIAACWLACGLDPDKAIFYRQSSVPETFELATTLMAFTPKGMMNRAHAYKAKVAENIEDKKDPDAGVDMGVYTYPILMAADIILFDADVVPVGKDQKQHVEMAADIAQAFNHNYGTNFFTIPEPIIHENTQIVTGLDGRKMSKSYDNTIPLFSPSQKLRKIVMKIVTNSQGVEESKNPENCNVFSLYKLFAIQQEQEILKQRYVAGGMGWGEAKQVLFEKIEAAILPMRERYERLIDDKSYIDEVLKKGAEKAREIASQKIEKMREIIGIN